MKIISQIGNNDVAAIWNGIADIRYDEISSGRDKSYNHVLMPIFEYEVDLLKPKNLLDAGCGLGFITQKVAKSACNILGVDLSKRSIELAQTRNISSNIKYLCSSIEDVSGQGRFDAIISNMVLMDCADHKAFIKACYRLLSPGGTLIATITNPAVWPRYWGYEKYAWFSYHATIHILADFKSSGAGNSGRKTIHTHRPMSEYMNSFIDEGFQILNVAEITGAVVNSRLLSKLPRYLKFKVMRPR